MFIHYIKGFLQANLNKGDLENELGLKINYDLSGRGVSGRRSSSVWEFRGSSPEVYHIHMDIFRWDSVIIGNDSVTEWLDWGR